MDLYSVFKFCKCWELFLLGGGCHVLGEVMREKRQATSRKNPLVKWAALQQLQCRPSCLITPAQRARQGPRVRRLGHQPQGTDKEACATMPAPMRPRAPPPSHRSPRGPSHVRTSKWNFRWKGVYLCRDVILSPARQREQGGTSRHPMSHHNPVRRMCSLRKKSQPRGLPARPAQRPPVGGGGGRGEVLVSGRLC